MILKSGDSENVTYKESLNSLVKIIYQQDLNDFLNDTYILNYGELNTSLKEKLIIGEDLLCKSMINSMWSMINPKKFAYPVKEINRITFSMSNYLLPRTRNDYYSKKISLKSIRLDGLYIYQRLNVDK